MACHNSAYCLLIGNRSAILGRAMAPGKPAPSASDYSVSEQWKRRQTPVRQGHRGHLSGTPWAGVKPDTLEISGVKYVVQSRSAVTKSATG